MSTTLVSTEDLAKRLGQSDLVICDVRHALARADAWGEAQDREGHIPGCLLYTSRCV